MPKPKTTVDPKSFPAQHWKNVLIARSRPNTSCPPSDKPIPVNMMSRGNCCAVKNCIPISYPSGVGSWPTWRRWPKKSSLGPAPKKFAEQKQSEQQQQ